MEQFRGTEAPVVKFALISRRPDVTLLVAWRHVWPWCVGWIVTSAIIYAGILAVDHPLALIIRDRTEPMKAAALLVHLPEGIAGITIIGTAALGAWRALIGQLRGAWRDAFLACLGICVALALKSELKVLFGRVPPEAWFLHQSAPLRNFHRFYYAGSFPSGHMAVLGVLLAFVWAYALPLRLLWLLVCGAVGGALMIMEAHFLTDLLAGALLGLTVGSVCRRIARM